MKTGFKISTGVVDANTDVGDLFVPRALFSQGGLWNWGDNSKGPLGDTTFASKSSPIQTVAGGTNWKLVASGHYHSVAIKTDGTLWTWGFNVNGGLGDNTVGTKTSPDQTIAGGTTWKQSAAGRYHSVAIKTDGTLWTWGRNTSGELGDNTIAHKSSPIQTVAGGANWKLVACGRYHNLAIKTDGTLWTWGVNGNGQLGDNTIAHKSSPAQTVAGGANWKQVAGGDLFSVAIKTDGTLWGWGLNTFGNLGDDSRVDKSSPVQTVAGGTNWKQVAAGNHTAAIKTDGTLWTWGYNFAGQLGDNTSGQNKSSPIQTIAGGTDWKTVGGGGNHIAAIKTDGTLWTWGFNGAGRLGDNTVANKSSPAQTIAGGTNWKYVATGALSSYTVAIKDDY